MKSLGIRPSVIIILPLFLLCISCYRGISIPKNASSDANITAYKRVIIYPFKEGLINTGVRVTKGQLFSVLTNHYHAMYYLNIQVNDKFVFTDYFMRAPCDGKLFVGYGVPPRARSGRLGVDIIVWEKDDWDQIVRFLKQLEAANPESTEVEAALYNAIGLKRLNVEKTQTLQAIKLTKAKIEDLRKSQYPTEVAKSHKANISEKQRQREIKKLEARLQDLLKTVEKLREEKRKWEEERRKIQQLTIELRKKEEKEKELVAQLEVSSKAAPVIVVVSPADGAKTDRDSIYVIGVVQADTALKRVEFFINTKKLETQRVVTGESFRDRARFEFHRLVSLRRGMNQIKIRAISKNGVSTEKIIQVKRIERRRRTWAVVVGINNYQRVPKLKYALNDARGFYDYLTKVANIPPENVVLLLDEKATLSSLRSALGTMLKRKASKDDTVIIFFAGHGATEKDALSLDGDGLEKYLLPYNADPNDLYATALPMREIGYIFRRVESDRLIFLADCCYSGASGGRTIVEKGMRAQISDAFMDRITEGKGRVVITASAANEIAMEKDQFRHGVFSYYILRGLRGEADLDGDRTITVSELFKYVSEHVPMATGQAQHPVMKSTVEGRLIIGRL